MGLEGEILAVSFAYVMLGALLLAVMARANFRRGFKIGAILAMSACYVVAFYGLQNLLGWSAPVAVPDRFQILWTRVIEPDPSRKLPGAIHLWLEELDDANLPSGVPRAYLLPYSTTLADRVSAAQAEIAKGHPQGGRAQLFGTPEGTVPPGALVDATIHSVSPGGDPSGGGFLDPSFLGGQSKRFEITPLLPPALPAKDEPDTTAVPAASTPSAEEPSPSDH